MDEERLQSRLSDDMERLDSRDPIERLTAVRNVRAFIETLEETAVAQARSADVRHSWDEIARVMGTTRWSVLRRFGPHGTHPAVDAPVPAADSTTPADAPREAFRALGSLPPELLQKVILLAGELVSSSVREGSPFSDSNVGIRLQVLPRSIRIELWDGQGRSRSTSPVEQPESSSDDETVAPEPVWIELDLPLEALLSEVSAGETSPVVAEGESDP